MSHSQLDPSMHTYAVHHSPNCAKPYQVRLIGNHKGCLDNLPAEKTCDIIGYGMTFEEAFAKALTSKNQHT